MKRREACKCAPLRLLHTSSCIHSRFHRASDDDKEPRQTCSACQNPYPAREIIRAPCDHVYCHGCIQSLFEVSMKDESLFPPRCCQQPIPPEEYPRLFDREFLSTFRLRQEELSSPNRTYCYRQTCAKFIPAAYINGQEARCPVCRARTCVRCKTRAPHDGDCPRDPAVMDVLRVAAENGYQRCFQCRALVERRDGCYHISK